MRESRESNPNVKAHLKPLLTSPLLTTHWPFKMSCNLIEFGVRLGRHYNATRQRVKILVRVKWGGGGINAINLPQKLISLPDSEMKDTSKTTSLFQRGLTGNHCPPGKASFS